MPENCDNCEHADHAEPALFPICGCERSRFYDQRVAPDAWCIHWQGVTPPNPLPPMEGQRS